MFRDGDLTRVTRDHTYVQDLIDDGRLDPADVPEHPWRNVVLRTVNAVKDGEPDLLDLQLVPGDRVLLASDGLTDLVAEAGAGRHPGCPLRRRRGRGADRRRPRRAAAATTSPACSPP